jgi:hypothetical protein
MTTLVISFTATGDLSLPLAALILSRDAGLILGTAYYVGFQNNSLYFTEIRLFSPSKDTETLF